MSSGFLIHNGLVLFYSSNLVVTSFTFFFFFSFLSFSSSIFGSSSSPSFFSLFSSSFGSSSSSSLISFSVVSSTYNSIGKAMNSECFLIKSLILFSSINSVLSYFICKTIQVPLVTFNGFSESSVIEKVPPAVLDHLHYLSSSFDFEITSTFSATK